MKKQNQRSEIEPSGYSCLDKLAGGFKCGEMVMFFANTRKPKTKYAFSEIGRLN